MPGSPTDPPCCGSLYFHYATCSLAHAEVAALPTEMPLGVLVSAHETRLRVCIQLEGGHSKIENSVTPDRARAVARRLLLAADEAERNFADAG